MIEIFHTLFRYKEKASPDKIEAYPERVHVDALPERRYLWTSRLLVVLSVISICFNMMLASTLYLLLPQISVYPNFFSINSYFSQIEMVQKREIRFPVSDLITEKYIDEYINLRYTITTSLTEMERRWRQGEAFYWYQTPQVYNEFMSSDYEEAMLKAKKDGMQRYVEVEWIRPLSRGLWQTQFKTYDIKPGLPPTIVYWRAVMRIRYVNLQFSNKMKRVLNPYGFLVESFSLAYHGREGEVESYVEIARKRSQGK